MTTILAIDPGQHSGWALIKDKEVILAEEADGDDVQTIWRLLNNLQQEYDIDRVVVEGQFMGSPRGYRTSCYRADIWYIASQILGLSVGWCLPSQWQSGLGIKQLKIEGRVKEKGKKLPKLTNKQKVQKRKYIKQQAVEIAKKACHYGPEDDMESDEGDAICIGIWAIDHLDKLS